MSNFSENRDLMLEDETSSQLHYYANQRLNFRGDISEHNKISWVVNDIVRKKIDSELKSNKIKKFELPKGGRHDTREDDQKYSFIACIKEISKPEKEYPKIILKDVIKQAEDKKYYERYDKERRNQAAKKFQVAPPDNIKGISFSSPDKL